MAGKPLRGDSNRKVATTQGPIREARPPDVTDELLTLREAEGRFGLHRRRIYAAVACREVHAVQVGGKGRIYYPEWELAALAARATYPPIRAA